ncbi:MAG: hypothetical protein IT423_21300 [Pirellulaceae bacterium]|nr:hypothetical protein [Pirellulaceae bacterium]
MLAAGTADVDGKSAQVQAKTSAIAGFGGAAMGFVGSLIGNAVRNYVAEQLHTLIQDRGKNATSD